MTRINNDMGTALKNKKRITKNTEFIKNHTKNVITEADQVLLVDLYHEHALSLRAAKVKISDFFEKIRGKFDSEYLLITNLENQHPRHKMLLAVNGSTSKFQDILEKEWSNSSVELADKQNATKYAESFSDFYLDAAESIPFTNQNSKKVKSKLFQKSRLK
jgi:hypothetical protein